MATKNVDYQLEVVCEHVDRDPNGEWEPRTVTVIVHVPQPDPEHGKVRFGWLEWSELLRPDGTTYGVMQTPFEVARHSTIYGRGDELAMEMGNGQRWRFHCEDCNYTDPRRHDEVRQVLAGLRAANVDRISVLGIASACQRLR